MNRSPQMRALACSLAWELCARSCGELPAVPEIEGVCRKAQGDHSL